MLLLNKLFYEKGPRLFSVCVSILQRMRVYKVFHFRGLKLWAQRKKDKIFADIANEIL